MVFQSVFRQDLFSGQTIIVTGGGTGIGRMIAHELASLGAYVVLSARRAEPLAQVREEIIAAGGQAIDIPCNIREEAEVVALFDQVLEKRDQVDGLVNNGGGQFFSPAEKISINGWKAVVETNLTGTFLMCREAFRRSMGRQGGAIVNILMDHWRGFPGMAHSSAARAGVENLTKTLAVEWARAGVRINSICPGVIQSSGLDSYPEAMGGYIEQAVQDTPMKRMGTESEISGTVAFLLSPAAAYISGATLKVDGASSLWRKTWDIEDHDNAPPRFNGYQD